MSVPRTIDARTAGMVAIAVALWFVLSFVLVSQTEWPASCGIDEAPRRERLLAMLVCSPRLLAHGPVEIATALDLWSPLLLAAFFLLRPRPSAPGRPPSSDLE